MNQKISIILFLFIIVVSNTIAQTPVDIYTAAKAGNVEAQKDLGLLKIQEGNYPEAMSWFKKAAEKNNADAQLNLAIMYRNGEGCSIDYSQAMFWFKKAAENVHPRLEAYGEIGLMYQRGFFGISKDLADAKTWYEKGASKGDKWSMLLLGRLYRDSGDMDNALTWFKKSADAGESEGALNVYALLEKKDLQTAMRYLKKSVDAGLPQAMFEYGINLLSGHGVARNDELGYKMIVEAAGKGCDDALWFLSKYKK